MRFASSHAIILFAAIFLTSCIDGAGYLEPKTVSYVQLPTPTAVEGEPPIESRKYESSGHTYYSQKFDDENIYPVPAGELTIARLYRAFGPREQDIPPQTIAARCRIQDDGTIYVPYCTAGSDSTADQRLALSLVGEGAAQLLPKFRKLPEGFANLSRSVTLTISTPEIAAPKVDLATGRLVDALLLEISEGGVGLSSGNYPSRALRQEIEGDMVVECQVQMDLSVICMPISFDPAEHFPLFEREGKRVFQNTRVMTFLKDGTYARGARFRTKVAWRIP